MSESFYKNLLEEWCPESSLTARIICAFQMVRDIPYGSIGEREPQQILRSNLGSCSGKHVLLNGLFRTLGIDSKILTCLHHFNEALPQGNPYPKKLQKIVSRYKVLDFHHYIKMRVGQKWVNVDATWDIHLKNYGFPVNVDWDGKSNTTVAVRAIKFFPQNDDIASLKKRLINGLSPEDREVRAEFLEIFTQWLKEIRV